jgi:hypothetical protein
MMVLRSRSPVVGDADIWRAAKYPMKPCGFEARLIAALYADLLFRCNDVEGFVVWTRIFGLVSEHVFAKLIEDKRVEQTHARLVSTMPVRRRAAKVTVF